jgi:hypothetical protein
MFLILILKENSDISKDETIMVEWDRQTSNDITSMKNYEDLFLSFPGNTFSKLESFSRHVRRQTISKFLARTEIFKNILNIHGSILDLGVAGGQSLMSWAQLSSIYEPLNYTRKIIGFDTFSGIPKITKNDTSGESPSQHLKEGGFSFNEIDSLKKAIQVYDNNRFLSHIPKIELISGDITKTVPEYLEKNQHLIVSLLHIDVDVYDPTITALKHVVPRMPKGSVIVFDEINQIPYPGETKAIIDTLGINNLKINRFTWETGISYAILD